MSSELNEFQNATVGMSCGIIEVLILQPLNYAKNMTQQKLPIEMNPMVAYRGVGSNCINMGSCTMIQFAVGGKFKQMILNGEARSLKPWEEITCGLGAGFLSATAGAPLELIMIQQQRKGSGTAAALKSIATPNNFFRGFVGAAIRESLWTCGYLSIPPIVRNSLRTNYPETFDSNEKARIPAAMLGGFFACYLSHPVDTIKTCMQGDIERKKFGTLTQTGRILYGEAGIPAFYRGATFRYGRMCCAVFLLDYLKGAVSKVYYPDKF